MVKVQIKKRGKYYQYTFEKAEKELLNFLESKNIFNVEIFLSNELPQANKTSGKYNHIYKNFEEKTKKLLTKMKRTNYNK